MLWDPLGAWPAGRRWLWAGLAAFVCLAAAPGFFRLLRPPREIAVDFFQVWASARNALSGLPVYTDHEEALERYLGFPRDSGYKVYFARSAQTPPAVLLGLPFAWLDYPEATLAWNLMSLAALAATLWLLIRELAIPFPAWAVFPVVTLLLVCSPLRQQVGQGQLNLVLLLLITGTWAAERSARPWLAGTLLGVVTGIKLFPGLLFVYFALRRQWRVVMAGTAGFLFFTGLTLAVLGPESYRSHVEEGLPHLGQIRAEWLNASLAGLWSKLFDAGPGFQGRNVEMLWQSPALARIGTALSCALLLALWAWVVWRARSRAQYDQAFGLTLTTMLLVSPITWDHYFLLLLPALALVWVALPPSPGARAFFLVVVSALWVKPTVLWNAFISGGYAQGVANPVQTLTVLSFQCYALLGLFAFGVLLAGSKDRSLAGRGHSAGTEESGSSGLALMRGVR
jgi:hypothetical protein